MTQLSSGLLETVSLLLGWGYVTAWSVSFYPQLILNWRRQSVAGLSADFVWLNVAGFACYTLFTVGSLLLEHGGGSDGDGAVRFNDAVFAGHAFLVSSATAFQLWFYGSRRDRLQQLSRRTPTATTRLSRPARITLTTIGLLLSTSAILLPTKTTLNLAASVKVFVSLVKYTPQLLLNFQKKSTVGWSIGNILLDATGGVLSFAQVAADSIIRGD
ncbi:hypothetical protein HK100_008932, partial [Physocladia obscura]